MRELKLRAYVNELNEILQVNSINFLSWLTYVETDKPHKPLQYRNDKCMTEMILNSL